ncbi:MAG: rRNA (cytosine967-C5)-methyltransferase [Actinomycetota bacterium]|nr:rRNA (cytosine967-C5)-methyltransferase [Actinomycetota bacterium]
MNSPRTGSRPARAKTRNVARREVDPARVVAWRTLRAVDERDAYANLELPERLRAVRMTGRDAALATELTYGALRGRGLYDAVLAACVDRPLDDVDPPLVDALRLGVHQLLATRVPPHAAVAATVDLVRAEIGQGAAGFANAVLRRVAAHDAGTWSAKVAPDAGTDPEGHLAVTRSHPEWIVRALKGALVLAGRPAGELPALLDADNTRPVVALVALPGLTDPAGLVAGGARQGSLSPLAVTVTGALDEVPAVRAGWARVQDEGSQLVALALAEVELTGPDTGRWLDVCAGPGGKSALLGATVAVLRANGDVPEDASLLANEITPHRVGLVRGSVAAVVSATPGVVEVVEGDGRELGNNRPGEFDRVLVDAPCTGLGALRRRPEARWRRRPADLASLGPLQRDLLRSALDAVRPGGVVAYATCSPHPAETRTVVTDALKGRDDVEQLDARAVLARVSGGRVDAATLGSGPAAQLWPHLHGCDAMFLALLRRR